MHHGKSRAHENGAQKISRPVSVYSFLVVAVVRAFVLGRRALGSGTLAALGAAVLRIVCIVCICHVGRIVCVVRTHDL